MEADHHNPWHEGTRQGLERLMALAVLVEAGARAWTDRVLMRRWRVIRTNSVA